MDFFTKITQKSSSLTKIGPGLGPRTRIWSVVYQRTRRLAHFYLTNEEINALERLAAGAQWMDLVPQEWIDIYGAFFDEAKSLTADEHQLNKIEKDIMRTFSLYTRNARQLRLQFRTVDLEPYYDALRDVLVAASHERSYCQGLNFLTAAFLITETSSRKAFILLSYLLKQCSMEILFNPKCSSLLEYMNAFEKRLRNHNRKLYKHFKRHNYSPVCYSIEWFTTCFVVSCPGDLANCVVDLILAGFADAMIRVGLALLDTVQYKLLGMDGETLQMNFKKEAMAADPNEVMCRAMLMRHAAGTNLLKTMMINSEKMSPTTELVNTLRGSPVRGSETDASSAVLALRSNLSEDETDPANSGAIEDRPSFADDERPCDRVWMNIPAIDKQNSLNGNHRRALGRRRRGRYKISGSNRKISASSITKDRSIRRNSKRRRNYNRSATAVKTCQLIRFKNRNCALASKLWDEVDKHDHGISKVIDPINETGWGDHDADEAVEGAQHDSWGYSSQDEPAPLSAIFNESFINHVLALQTGRDDAITERENILSTTSQLDPFSAFMRNMFISGGKDSQEKVNTAGDGDRMEDRKLVRFNEGNEIKSNERRGTVENEFKNKQKSDCPAAIGNDDVGRGSESGSIERATWFTNAFRTALGFSDGKPVQSIHQTCKSCDKYNTQREVRAPTVLEINYDGNDELDDVDMIVKNKIAKGQSVPVDTINDAIHTPVRESVSSCSGNGDQLEGSAIDDYPHVINAISRPENKILHFFETIQENWFTLENRTRLQTKTEGDPFNTVGSHLEGPEVRSIPVSVSSEHSLSHNLDKDKPRMPPSNRIIKSKRRNRIK